MLILKPYKFMPKNEADSQSTKLSAAVRSDYTKAKREKDRYTRITVNSFKKKLSRRQFEIFERTYNLVDPKYFFVELVETN